jgi:hypothetical protein
VTSSVPLIVMLSVAASTIGRPDMTASLIVMFRAITKHAGSG